MQATKEAMAAYDGRRKAVKSDRETLIGLWDVDLFDKPTKGMNCFMHTYLGLAVVMGGLQADLKGCGVEKEADDAAAHLRVLLAALA